MQAITTRRLRRVTVFAALASTLAVSACSSAFINSLSSQAPPSPAAHVAPGNSHVAAEYAPLVNLAKDEKYFEADTQTFIDNSSLQVAYISCAGGQTTPVLETVADRLSARRLGNGGYAATPRSPCPGRSASVTTKDDTSRAGVTFALNLKDDKAVRAGSPDGHVPVYWQYVEAPDGKAAYVYWLFYAYDKFTVNHHEADWERVAVQLDRGRPTGVTFWRHDSKNTCYEPWSAVEKARHRPVTYSAVGSHASYAYAGVYPTLGKGFLPDSTDSGRRWDTGTDLRRADSAPWWGYRGWWGGAAQGLLGHSGLHKGDHGIAGPSAQRGLGDAFPSKVCTDQAHKFPS